MNKRATDTLRLSSENLDEIRASVGWQSLFAGLRLRKAENKTEPPPTKVRGFSGS